MKGVVRRMPAPMSRKTSDPQVAELENHGNTLVEKTIPDNMTGVLVIFDHYFTSPRAKNLRND